MNELKIYYNEENLKIEYDSNKDFYWLEIGEHPAFPIVIEARVIQDFYDLKGSQLLKKLDSYDNRIIPTMVNRKVSFLNLEKAFSTVKEKELTSE